MKGKYLLYVFFSINIIESDNNKHKKKEELLVKNIRDINIEININLFLISLTKNKNKKIIK